MGQKSRKKFSCTEKREEKTVRQCFQQKESKKITSTASVSINRLLLEKPNPAGICSVREGAVGDHLPLLYGKAKVTSFYFKTTDQYFVAIDKINHLQRCNGALFCRFFINVFTCYCYFSTENYLI